MSAHTPGPWGFNGGYVLPVNDDSATLVADCHIKGRDWNESQANAILIAAAPELYEALEEFVGPERDLTEYSCHVGLCTPEECGRCSRELRARAVLAKARGEA